MPLLWERSVTDITCAKRTYYMIDYGQLYSDVYMRTICVYLWVILGLVIPFIVLAFCNIYLVLALRKSVATNNTIRKHTFSGEKQNDAQIKKDSDSSKKQKLVRKHTNKSHSNKTKGQERRVT